MFQTIKQAVLRKKAELLCVVLASGILAVIINWVQNCPCSLLVKLIPIFVLGIIAFYVQQILPVRIHQQRTLGVLAFDYLIWSLFLETILFFVSLNVTVNLYTFFYLFFFILSHCLFCGFICAAERETGLWQGIKQIFKKHFWKMVCLITVLRLLQAVSHKLFEQLPWAQGLWGGLLYIGAVYILIAWMESGK